MQAAINSGLYLLTWVFEHFELFFDEFIGVPVLPALGHFVPRVILDLAMAESAAAVFHINEATFDECFDGAVESSIAEAEPLETNIEMEAYAELEPMHGDGDGFGESESGAVDETSWVEEWNPEGEGGTQEVLTEEWVWPTDSTEAEWNGMEETTSAENWADNDGAMDSFYEPDGIDGADQFPSEENQQGLQVFGLDPQVVPVLGGASIAVWGQGFSSDMLVQTAVLGTEQFETIGFYYEDAWLIHLVFLGRVPGSPGKCRVNCICPVSQRAQLYHRTPLSYALSINAHGNV